MAHEKAMLFIGSDRPIPGRDAEAMNLWRETGAWLDAQSKAGHFERWDGFWLTPHGSTMNAAFVCYGSREKLDAWRRTDEFEAWVFRAGQCLGGLCVVPGVNYAATTETLKRRSKALGD